jgi:putative oligomerization/nucleic acid binding protein
MSLPGGGRWSWLGRVTPEADVSTPQPARRRRSPYVLIVIGSLLAFLSIFALWANRQLLDTDNWTKTSSELLANKAIRTQTADFLVQEVYDNVDVQGELAQVLPPRAAPLAGPAAGGLKSLAEKGAYELLGRPRPQAVWEDANRAAHTVFLRVIDDEGEFVSTADGVVTLDLKALLEQTAARIGVGGRLAGALPQDAAQIEIIRADELALAQDVVHLLRAAAFWFVALGLGLLALAVWLAAGWRRRALRAAGFGLLLAGIAALVARNFAGDQLVTALASTSSVEPAVEAAWTISTSLMVEAASAAIAYGIFMIGAAWLAGPTRVATAIRRTLAPYLREPRLAYAAWAVVALLLLAWGPTPAFRKAIPALILVGLLALGVEALRRQTAREFPDASREEMASRMRGRVAGVGRWMRDRRPAHAANGQGNGAVAVDRIDQLERLARLRDSGVLDPAEFEREKAEILGSTTTKAPEGQGV